MAQVTSERIDEIMKGKEARKALTDDHRYTSVFLFRLPVRKFRHPFPQQ